MRLDEDSYDVRVLVDDGNVEGVVCFVGDAEHYVGDLGDEEANQLGSSIAAGGMEEVCPVQ